MATKKLTGEEKIISLANKLVKAINEQGLSIMNPDIFAGFGGLDILIHRYDTDNPTLLVCKICENGGDKFEFEGKPIEGLK
jgi:hypothetical protein